jgi:hypothetical protein
LFLPSNPVSAARHYTGVQVDLPTRIVEFAPATQRTISPDTWGEPRLTYARFSSPAVGLSRRRSTSIAHEWRAGISRPVVCPGDRTKRCSISANGPFYSLTNEVDRNLQGTNSNTITALNGSFVQARRAPTAVRSIGRTKRIGHDATMVDSVAMVTGIAVEPAGHLIPRWQSLLDLLDQPARQRPDFQQRAESDGVRQVPRQ